MSRTHAILAVLAALGAGGCSSDDGPSTTQTRDLAQFSRLENPGSVDVRLRVGTPQRVRIVAGRDVIDDVRTDVRDGTLRVTFDGGDGLWESDVAVEASVPELAGVDVSGSGDVEADGIDSNAFAVRSSGSGDIKLEGSVQTLATVLDGSGDADLTRLRARAASAAVSGSGDLALHAERRLAVVIDGSGDVRYSGNPRLMQTVDGSGELRRTDPPYGD